MTRRFYDIEHDTILTLEDLKDSFMEDLTDDDRENYRGNFWLYLAACTGKNGILEEL